MSGRGKALVFMVLITGTIIFLCLPAQRGFAQEPTPTETPSATSTETSVSTDTAVATETATPVETEPQISPTANDQPTTRLLIRVSRNARLENVMVRMDLYGQVIENEELGRLRIFIINVPSDRLDQKMSELLNVSGVAWVEPDYPVQALETMPNDPLFLNQYALAAIRGPQGWDLSTGTSSVTIAILDSGIDLSHPDLANKIVPGFNTLNPNNPPQDDFGHGTHVAGIAAASTNNGLGIAGVSWGARLMPVKVLNASGGGKFSEVAEGIVWATDHGAQIINMSLGGANYSQTLETAVGYSANHGVLLIAASGNSNSNTVLYPARFPEVMAVAATDANNQRASFSNYGPEVEIAAPGVSILSSWPGGGYNMQNGTSMAAPYISGVAAILLGYENNPSLVRQHLKESALDIAPAGFDIYTGAGLVQMDAALRLAIPTPTAVIPTFTVQITSNQHPVINPPAFSTLTPVWTQTSLTTFAPVPMISATPLPSTLSTSTLQLIPSNTSEVDSTPELEALAHDYDFSSPLLCGGIIFIVLGSLILFFVRKQR